MKIIVKGDTPVWDKDAKCYIGKLELDAKTSASTDEDSALEDELEIGSNKPETTIIATTIYP